VHSRQENAEWRLRSAGFLSKARVLEVVATRDIAAGEAISLDYAPDKVESQVKSCGVKGRRWKGWGEQGRVQRERLRVGRLR